MIRQLFSMLMIMNVKILINIILPINELTDRAWNGVRYPIKWRKSSLRQTLQVRVTSDTQKIQSSDWPKCRCMLWRKVNSSVLVGHQRSFQQVCQYVNFMKLRGTLIREGTFIRTNVVCKNCTFACYKTATLIRMYVWVYWLMVEKLLHWTVDRSYQILLQEYITTICSFLNV